MRSSPTESDLVKAWLGSSLGIQDAVQRLHPEPGTSLGDLEAVLKRMALGTQDVDAVSREAEPVTQRLEDPRLRGIFLARWAYWSADAGRLTEAESLVRRALETLPRDAPLECFAPVQMARVNILFWKGDFLGYRELFKKTLDQCPKRSPRRLLILNSIAWDLAGYGRLAELTEWPREGHRGDLKGDDLELLTRTDFTNEVQTGALERAKALAPTARDSLPRILKDEQTQIRYHLDLLRLQEGLWTPPPSSAAQDDLLPQRMLEVLFRLTQGKPREALACARTLEIDSKNQTWAMYGWTTILRAELACGNHLAARRLLEKERERSGEHYLDDLFLARMERLAGHPEAAQGHFTRLLERIAFYKAEGRLDFELRMACELPSGDVFKWTRAAKPASSPTPLTAMAHHDPTPSPDAPRLIGTSPAMEAIRKLIRDVASHDAPVLITGETGTGKDLAARAVHHEGTRKEMPFLAVNCSGITESLLASELFGHVKGAFTGAEKDRPGLFEQAGKGTIFLDEIGDISPGLQVALLRVLDQGEIRPVGADRDRKIKCRIVAATNADLEARVKAGTFREDLLFRLQRMTLHIPPLRERRRDLADLIDHFLNKGRPEGMHASISGELLARFERYDWPGNVRELANAIERMRVLNSDKLDYEAEDLDPALPLRAQTPDAVLPGKRPPTASADYLPDDDIEAALHGVRSPLRRRARLKEIFLKHKTLSTAEVKAIAKVSRATVVKDLAALCREGFIRKIEKSHYYGLHTGPPMALH